MWGSRRARLRSTSATHVSALINDRISDYSLAALNIKHLREFKLRRLDTNNIRNPGRKISSETVRKDLMKISSVFNWY